MAVVIPMHALCVVFFAVMAYCLYQTVSLHFPPACVESYPCFPYYLRNKPNISLVLYISSGRNPGNNDSVEFLNKVPLFDYTVPQQLHISLDLSNPAWQYKKMYLVVCMLTSSFKSIDWDKLLKEETTICLGIKLTHRMMLPPQTDDYNENLRYRTKSLEQVNHLNKLVGFNVLVGLTEIPHHSIPRMIKIFFRITRGGINLPVMHHDLMLERRSNMVPITPDNRTARIILKYKPINYGQLRLLVAAELKFIRMSKLNFTEEELDEIKGSTSRTGLYYSDIIATFSTMHMILDIFAIVNDYNFWMGRDSFVGISIRTLVWQVIGQGVVFFYLLIENKFWLLIMSSGLGLVLEMWKLYRTMPFDFKKMKFKNIDLSDEEVKTRKLDAQAMTYVSYMVVPLFLTMTLLHWVYDRYLSLETFINFIYVFNILFMLPQIYLNHKFKSVSHLPWMSVVYRGCNTFIDDLFVYAMDTTAGSRVTWFRDDLILIIYFVQKRWYMDPKKSENKKSSGPRRPRPPVNYLHRMSSRKTYRRN